MVISHIDLARVGYVVGTSCVSDEAKEACIITAGVNTRTVLFLACVDLTEIVIAK